MIYLHLRVSTDRQEREGQGLDAQEAYGRGLFVGQSIKVVREVGSGRKESLQDRPILRATIDQLKEGDTLWFYDEDRLARDNGVKKELLKALRRKKARLHIRNEEFDIYDMQDCLRLGLKGELDEYMGRFIVERMKAGREMAVIKKGRWYGGITAYGYKQIEGDPKDIKYHNIIPDPEEAKVYRQMVRWCLVGIGTNKIAMSLNNLGHKTNFTKKGRKGQQFLWRQAVVVKMLRNPIYKGEYRYKEHKIEVPPLISEKEWNKVQVELHRRRIQSKRNTKRFYLLRQLLSCDRCGRNFFGKIKERMRRWSKNGKLHKSSERVYCCMSKRKQSGVVSCGMPSINIDRANELVWANIREYILHSKKLREAITAQKDTSFVDRAGLDAELAGVRKKVIEKDNEVKDLLRGKGRFRNVSDFQIDDLAGEIKSEKENLLIAEQELLAKIAKLDSIEDRGEEIEEFLATLADHVDELTEQEKSDVLHAIIAKVGVSFDESLKQHRLNICLAIQDDVVRGHTPSKVAEYPFNSIAYSKVLQIY